MISWKIKGFCRCAPLQQVGSQFSQMISKTPHKTIVLCPGQSSQYIGMIRNNGMTEKMKDMTDTAKKILGYDIVKICQHGPEELLSRTIHCQPAVVVASLLAFEILKEKGNDGAGLQLESIAGYSVGEISALCMAEVLSYEEAISLLKERANAMDYASNLISSGMLTLQGLPIDETKEMCEELNDLKNDPSHHVSIAIEQFPNAVSIGGSILMLNKIMNREHILLKDLKKIKLSMVNVSGAFHTRYMLPAQEHLSNILSRLQFKYTNINLYSNVTGRKYDFESQSVEDLLLRQIAEPVLWNTIMTSVEKDCKDKNVNLYEVGPGKQLKAILSKIDRKLVRKIENISI